MNRIEIDSNNEVSALMIDRETTPSTFEIKVHVENRNVTSNCKVQNYVTSFKEKKACNKLKAQLIDRLEILKWIRCYNIEWAINDLIAGVTLGLTIIPESIACALLAGIPARYGLCSAFLGSFIYLIFGSIHKVIMGPTSLVALVSLQFTVGKPIEFAFLLTLFSGIVQIIMGCTRLGFIFEFISIPVIKAFSSATAILVIESQIKVLLGIKYLVSGLVESLRILLSRFDEANYGDFAMGACAIMFLLTFDQFERFSRHPKMNRNVKYFLRYLSFSRNTLVVLITGYITFIWVEENHYVPYALSKNALSGLPNFTFPSLTVRAEEKTYTVWDILSELNIGIFVIPIVGILTNISIGKLNPRGSVDTDKELLTVGLCNILGACVQSMPTSGAFARYAISSACNLKTPMANLYTGIVVLLALGFVSSYFNYIPEATLAAILMCSIYTLIDFKLPGRLWRESKRDFCIWLLCFLSCIFFGVEVGLFVSIIGTMLHLLYLWARPDIIIGIDEHLGIQHVKVAPQCAIFYPAISYLREKVLHASENTNFAIPIVIDCLNITGLDYTAAHGLSKLSQDLYRRKSSINALLILYRMDRRFLKLIDPTDNLVFCENYEKVAEFLTQESLRSGKNIYSQAGHKIDV